MGEIIDLEEARRLKLSRAAGSRLSPMWELDRLYRELEQAVARLREANLELLRSREHLRETRARLRSVRQRLDAQIDVAKIVTLPDAAAACVAIPLERHPNNDLPGAR